MRPVAVPEPPRQRAMVAVFVAFAATIPAANWLIGHVGHCIPQGPCLIPVGFGLVAPSGVLMIGLALVLRDWLHELAGWRWAAVAVLVGGALSLLVSPPALALASAVAFTLAELADLAVYAPLRKRGRHIAVLASGVVGAALDSALFVWLAFGSLDFSAGTALAKIYASAAAALLVWLRSRCGFGLCHQWGPGGHPLCPQDVCVRCGALGEEDNTRV